MIPNRGAGVKIFDELRKNSYTTTTNLALFHERL